jgi:hypothetical protein
LERIEKPWGHKTLFAATEKYIGKILFIKRSPTKSAMSQTKRRDLLLLEGEPSLIIKNGSMTDILPLVPDCSYHIEPVTIQRVEATEDTILVEVSIPEADSVARVEHDYGRASGSP